MHIIENEFLKVTVREYGAELTSIIDKKNKLEHLWNAEETVWPWHAPVLFPIVGRSLNDEILIDGVKYLMEKHGLARKHDFAVMERSEDKLVFSLTATEDTLVIYPYRFEFLIGYRLKQNTLHVSYEVRNTDTKEIYFQLGGHPAFAVPFKPTNTGHSGNEKYEDYYLEFEHTENSNRHYIDGDGFFNGQTEKVLNNTNRLPLQSDLFKDDALIFKDLKSRKVTIGNKNNGHYLSVAYPDFNYLGVWAKVNAPYVCIEPWLGCADTAGDARQFKDKEGVIKLLQAKSLNANYIIEVG